MVEVFVKWFKDNNQRLRSGGVRVELKSRVDINQDEPPGGCGVIVCWSRIFYLADQRCPDLIRP